MLMVGSRTRASFSNAAFIHFQPIKPPRWRCSSTSSVSECRRFPPLCHPKHRHLGPPPPAPPPAPATPPPHLSSCPAGISPSPWNSSPAGPVLLRTAPGRSRPRQSSGTGPVHSSQAPRRRPSLLGGRGSREEEGRGGRKRRKGRKEGGSWRSSCQDATSSVTITANTRDRESRSIHLCRAWPSKQTRSVFFPPFFLFHILNDNS